MPPELPNLRELDALASLAQTGLSWSGILHDLVRAMRFLVRENDSLKDDVVILAELIKKSGVPVEGKVVEVMQHADRYDRE